MLYLIATPIGNLQDISLRALEVLKTLDSILCEDTRRSNILFQKHGIKTPLESFHKFTERKMEDKIICALHSGKRIGLISDAGTPGINDPGQSLVERCRQEKIQVTSLPGPCSPIVALSLSGFSYEKFQCIGFLPKKEMQRKQALLDAFFYPGVTVCFESPHRIQKTLREISLWGSQRDIAIVRELTKIHEECVKGKAKDFLCREFRGEIVLIIEGNETWGNNLSTKEHVELLQHTYDLEKREAIFLVAKLRNVPKKEVYTEVNSKLGFGQRES